MRRDQRQGDDANTTADIADTEPPATGVSFPLQRYLGMELSGAEAGTGTATLTIGDQHVNPNGVAHGAVLFALVDTAMGKATTSVLDDGLYCASVEVSLRFIRPASTGELIADASVVKRGRSIVHLDARVHDTDGRLVATSAGTFAILGG
jgi:acyl-CoA thioesterase